MPAGTGKTEIIAALGRLADEADERALILTHTHAGVDALRRRIKRHGVRPGVARIETVASWSHLLVRQYPYLAGVTVPDEPNWKDSALYYEGATHVLESRTIQRVLTATYAFAIVDEYQDCTMRQHSLAQALAAALPIAVFGDPLQAIFGWDKSDPLPSWAGEIQSLWPDLPIDAHPWRWKGHNEQLGERLLTIRENFKRGLPIRIGEGTPVRWVQSGNHPAMISECRNLRNQFSGGTIVAIGFRSQDCHRVAAKLHGSYSVMETIEGKDMIDYARVIDEGDPARIAAATAEWGKKCISGISEMITKDDVRRLAKGKPTARLRRPGAEAAHKHLSAILTSPSPATIREALGAVECLPGKAIYRHDAWYTVLNSLRTFEAGARSVAEVTMQYRNRTRATGRRTSRYAISRPTLIKGLEYDHAVILDADQHDPTSLYVALTRARKTLTVISAQPELRIGPLQANQGPGRTKRRSQHLAPEQGTLL